MSKPKQQRAKTSTRAVTKKSAPKRSRTEGGKTGKKSSKKPTPAAKSAAAPKRSRTEGAKVGKKSSKKPTRTPKAAAAPKRSPRAQSKVRTRPTAAASVATPKVPKRLMPLFAKAERGEPKACFEIFQRWYSEAPGVEELRLGFLRIAAKAGIVDAQMSLAYAVSEEDPPESLDWARRAAAGGHVHAQYWVGLKLLKGARGVPVDTTEAMRYIEGAAKAGSEEAVALLRNIRRRQQTQAKGQRAVIEELITERGLGRRRKAILGMLQPSIRAVASPALGEDVALRASRLGGSTDLPRKQEWPTYEGRPLSFLAQIDLAAVAPFDETGCLPRTGLLSFFYDVEGMFEGNPHVREKNRVLFFAPGTRLERRPSPEGVETFQPCSLTFRSELTLAPFRTALARSLRLNDDEAESYCELSSDVAGGVQGESADDGKVHRLLGHPDVIQGDLMRRLVYGLRGVDVDSVVAKLEAEAARWKLLLQIDSDDDAAMMWGDAGRLYYLIREDALRDAKFDDVYVQLQCH